MSRKRADMDPALNLGSMYLYVCIDQTHKFLFTKQSSRASVGSVSLYLKRKRTHVISDFKFFLSFSNDLAVLRMHVPRSMTILVVQTSRVLHNTTVFQPFRSYTFVGIVDSSSDMSD